MSGDAFKTWLRVSAAIGLCVAIAMLLFGCGNRRAGVTTIRFVAWGNEVEERSLRTLIAQFEKRHPKIRVDLEITPWARMLDKLMISTAGGRPPDVTRISSEWSAPVAAKGLLEPLDNYVKRDHYDLDDFYPEAIEGWGKYNHVLYAIPTDIDVYAMYYNKTMFDKYKLPYPDWTWDWDKYIDAAKKMTKDLSGHGLIDQWGASADFWWQSYVYQNGGTILSQDERKCTSDQPAAYGGLQFMSDLVNKYHVAPGAEESANIGNMKLFTSGRIGMFISGSWAAELVFKKEIKDFDYDVAPLPRGPKARATFIGGAAYGILARSAHKREAWELVKWITGPQYQRSAAVQSQIIPSRKSVALSGAYLKLNQPPKARKVFLDMIQYGHANPPVACSPEMNQIIASEMELMMLGKEPAKAACAKLTPVIDQLLRHQE